MNTEIQNPKIKMLNGYIMIKDLPLEDIITKTGLIIPKDKYQRIAEVYAVGEDSKFQVGDIIIKPIGKTTPVKINDVEYECIRESFIFAKM